MFTILTIIGRYNAFKKLGVTPWYAIIPFYCDYISWKKSSKSTILFWVSLLLTTFSVGTVCYLMFSSGIFSTNARDIFAYSNLSDQTLGIIYVIIMISNLVWAIFRLILLIRLAHLFGYSGALALLGFILDFVFWLILGFSKKIPDTGSKE